MVPPSLTCHERLIQRCPPEKDEKVPSRKMSVCQSETWREKISEKLLVKKSRKCPRERLLCKEKKYTKEKRSRESRRGPRWKKPIEASKIFTTSRLEVEGKAFENQRKKAGTEEKGEKKLQNHGKEVGRHAIIGGHEPSLRQTSALTTSPKKERFKAKRAALS